MLAETMLQIDNVVAGYGKKEVLRGVSVSVRSGELLALIGPNGSGKSTLLKVACGALKPRSGNVMLAGQSVTATALHKRVRLGLSYFTQGGPVFPSLTVAENIRVAAAGTRRLPFDDALDLVLSTFPVLADRLKIRAGLLSGGQRQMLALGMVLVHRPQVLLLDEPSAGLSPGLAREIMATVRTLGITIVLVEQRVREALEIADRAIILVNGKLAAETDEPQDWLTDGAIEPFFFGGSSRQTPVPR